VGEPPLRALPPVARREWLRCEAAANLALPWVPAVMACAYDVGQLDASHDETLDGLRATHEALASAEGGHPNPRYLDPRQYAARCDRAELPPPPSAALEFAFDVNTYAHSRRLAAEYAGRAGLTEEQECDLSLALTELATNAVRHGGGHGVLRLWLDGRELFCEVSDHGPGLRDPLTGYIQPRAGTATSGWGVWLVRRISDVVEVRTGSGGTTIRMMLQGPAGAGAPSASMSHSATRTLRRLPAL
jgi:anti-sigma regulatory factor (Ser/Thr protein kinase)